MSSLTRGPVIKGLVCIAVSALPVLSGFWYLLLLQAGGGTRGLQPVAVFFSALMFGAGVCFAIGGVTTAAQRAPHVTAGLLYFGAVTMLLLAAASLWSIGVTLLVVGGVLLLVATVVSTAPRPMVMASGAAPVVVAGGFWVAVDPPFSPRYATVGPDFRLTGGTSTAPAIAVPPDATQYLVPGTRGPDGRCGFGFSSDMAGGSRGGMHAVQLESRQETCESILAVWQTDGNSSISFSGGAG